MKHFPVTPWGGVWHEWASGPRRGVCRAWRMAATLSLLVTSAAPMTRHCPSHSPVSPGLSVCLAAWVAIATIPCGDFSIAPEIPTSLLWPPPLSPSDPDTPHRWQRAVSCRCGAGRVQHTSPTVFHTLLLGSFPSPPGTGGLVSGDLPTPASGSSRGTSRPLRRFLSSIGEKSTHCPFHAS